ncbi:RNA polymerase factor sigma-54 [Psychrobacillus lasiicapitis]|uniref:RNA polymerase factor sigma-54 n=1 Tax=Psychrobacillus lasiicapitis TaxID=1636719 RepID=A0A544T918_9BACI|nr:RNA polymerase factor sigma-54 [Psychrobacillus lasiicapitis]TQR13896.1 RNA polymerase factor sigma-54 [Psychrobacillus lasiicapitis]GGA36349.1 RNA polymerase sigma-54 factor [Psychrobacillus lasiicapitis]
MELVLNQRQEQSLTMTFQLRQAIELLQYSTYDLYQYIKEKELENPLIELEEHSKDFSSVEKSTRKLSSSSTKQLIDYVKGRDICKREKLYQEAKLYFKQKEDQQLLYYIIYNLDDNGYFHVTDQDPFDENTIERGIHLLQQIGPVGIGARSLQECLMLQVIYEFPEANLVQTLLENHFDLLANRKWNEIARLMKISLADVKEMYDFIQALDPKPSFSSSDDSVEYVNPDIIVEYKEGNFTYYLNDGYLPEIHFNNEYAGLLQEKDETSKYINNQYTQYKWLLSSIEQRRSTILKIVKVLLEKQKKFFTEGYSSLKPLTLKEVAMEIDMHESTISRATMHKVIQTPRGSFDLKSLFTSKLETADGSSISQTEVKELLANFIKNENKTKPLSDQKIADYLNTENGINISRRTISKYREELNIPSSSLRKEISI